MNPKERGGLLLFIIGASIHIEAFVAQFVFMELIAMLMMVYGAYLFIWRCVDDRGKCDDDRKQRITKTGSNR